MICLNIGALFSDIVIRGVVVPRYLKACSNILVAVSYTHLNMMKDIEQRLMYQGLTLKQYTELTGKKETDIRKDFEEQANKNVKYRLVLEAVVKAENIEDVYKRQVYRNGET